MIRKKREPAGKKTSGKEQLELGARRKLIEELFQDFNHSRTQVYKMNFIRGMFFGFGSVLGGTLLVALTVWLLSVIGQHIPFLSDIFKATSETLNSQ